MRQGGAPSRWRTYASLGTESRTSVCWDLLNARVISNDALRFRLYEDFGSQQAETSRQTNVLTRFPGCFAGFEVGRLRRPLHSDGRRITCRNRAKERLDSSCAKMIS